MAKSKTGKRATIRARQVRRYVPADPVFRDCHACNGTMEGRHQNYPYKECGLDNVVLIDVLVFHCSCGEIALQIPAMSMLHCTIAFELIKKPTLLSGQEVRYLRNFVGYTAREFADMLGTTNITVSRWENGFTRITRNNDRVLRLAFFMAILEREAEAAVGPDNQTQVPDVIAFAQKVKTFNLTSFLKTIRDVHEQSSIKVDPRKLAEFGDVKHQGVLMGPSELVN